MTRRIAYIATGGTISCIGTDPHDLLDYTDTGQFLNGRQLLDKMGPLDTEIAIDPVDFRAVDSTHILPRDWFELAQLCVELAASPQAYDGIVITHGTASMEETAFALSCVLDLDIPVILTGAMRPSSGMSSDGDRNLASSLRAAASPRLRGFGVVLLLNDQLHDPATVTKTHSLALDTFQSPDSGPIGHMIGSHLRLRVTPHMARPRFEIRCLRDFSRVDISYSYAGADGAATRAFVAAGAAGIVAAGFAPGMLAPSEIAALQEAVERGVVVVVAHRAAGGPAIETMANTRKGFIPAGALSPVKARILLGLSLARSDGPAHIRRTFEEFSDGRSDL